MPPNDTNRIDERHVVEEVVQIANLYAFDEAKTNIDACFRRPKNRLFIAVHQYTPYDIRSLLSALRVEEYSYTSSEAGKPDAYVFGPDTRDDFDVFLKFTIENGVIVLSFHDPERALSFPYRGC